ncbi:MAG: recombinase RecA [Treponema sp.]|jgi:recombination protein RecA|nr:recombinase RecA [Treponema sp.]
MAKVSETEKTRGDPLASAEEKKKALEAARLQIEKQFGAGSIIQLGNASSASGIEVVPSGSILLDEALGIGGYPRGRIIEIYGPESSGKTTLALHAIAEAQKLGGIAAFVDAEHALDPVYAKNLGVNIDELWVSQPDSGEQALEITENLVRSGAVDVIVVDSVAALTPQAEIDGDMGDAQMGLQARLMSQAMRKLTAIIGKSRTILIFINQIRMKIGIMFGNPETTTGGNALKFYSSVRLEVRKTETIEGGKDTDAVGNRVRVKVVKNKVAAPFRRAELEVIFGKGVSASASLLDAAVKYALIDKKGAWYSHGEEKIGQGRDSAREYLEKNPGFAQELEVKIRKLMFPGREFPAAKAAPGPAVKPAAPVPPAPGPVEIPVPVEGANIPPDPSLEAVPSHEALPRMEVPPQDGPQPPRLEANPREAPPQTGPARSPSPAVNPPEIQSRRGRPPANAARPAAVPSRPVSPRPVQGPGLQVPGPGEASHRGPGRPRKAAPGNGEDALF